MIHHIQQRTWWKVSSFRYEVYTGSGGSNFVHYQVEASEPRVYSFFFRSFSIFRITDSFSLATALPLFQSTTYFVPGQFIQGGSISKFKPEMLGEHGWRARTTGRLKLSGLSLNFFSASFSVWAPEITELILLVPMYCRMDWSCSGVGAASVMSRSNSSRFGSVWWV